ncbi:hypothetical protein [Candidatus Poriferisodalis sp.]|uniref:hypothetical protein n=1 Tax=Candidatus Poriferisodalis sp. TaxID=3101277 RepID=UPI003B51E4B9
MVRRGSLKRPRDDLEHNSEWPDGRLADHAPPEARLAQAVSQRLRRHLTDHNLSLRQAARLAAASRQALFNAIHGNTWSDLAALARIEHGLGIELWGNEHRVQECSVPS